MAEAPQAARPGSPPSLGDEVRALIERHGPIPLDEVIERALYDPVAGFYSAGGAAGRRGDFITSPEVGPLFGAVVSRALDGWWQALGRPDPFVVVEAGAGAGTLALAVRAARPACLPALTYVLVERSAPLRARHAEHLSLVEPAFALPPHATDREEPTPQVLASGPRFVSLGELPAVALTGVVLANELLDNLPFRVLERGPQGWLEVRVGTDDSGRLAEQLVPSPDDLADVVGRLAPTAPLGGRVPVQRAAADWLRSALALVTTGRVVVIDYASDTATMAERSEASWLRTYRGHQRGGPLLEHLGRQDVTTEVAVDQLARVRPPGLDRSQAAFLRAHGIDDLVDEGRRIWAERAHLGDLEAVRGRSRVGESDALLDPDGLGAFRVLEWPVAMPV